jgi:hypothetical protein
MLGQQHLQGGIVKAESIGKMFRVATSGGNLGKMRQLIGIILPIGRQKLFLPQSLAPKMRDFWRGSRYNRPGGGLGVSSKLAMGHT